MDIKSVVFDIGGTLVNYNAPLSWKSMHPDALRKVMMDCEIDGCESNSKIDLGVSILSKYNTRENYREHEVSSDAIFNEIFDAWGLGRNSDKLPVAKKAFYNFFQYNAKYFCDAAGTLEALSAKGISIGFLTDVAYGMDNIYSLKDIAEIRKYFNFGFTSIDVGYRKPHPRGYQMLLAASGVACPSQMVYVGDEEKDVLGANNVGIVSVLINRENAEKNWGQKHTIMNLSDIVSLAQIS